MIDSIRPKTVVPGQGNIIANVGDLSFTVEMAQRDIDFFLNKADPLNVFISLELSDKEMTLVGFANKDRRELYRSLKNVAGIGSKSGLTIIDCGEVVDILRAVSGKDFQFLKEVPGVGQKRIEAIFKELEKRYQKALPKPLPIEVRVWVESREALMLEGLSFSAAERLIVDVLKTDPEKKWTSEEIYKNAAGGDK